MANNVFVVVRACFSDRSLTRLRHVSVQNFFLALLSCIFNPIHVEIKSNLSMWGGGLIHPPPVISASKSLRDTN